MKIRTDFVTNSSSSSFVAMLYAELDNGERLTASVESSKGGEGGGWIRPPHADYEWDIWKIGSMEELREECVEIDGKKRRIKSGSVRLMCHTYGEYGYEADPIWLIKRYFGYKWEKIFDSIDPNRKEDDDDEQVNELRKMPELKQYTEDSLRTLINIVRNRNEYGPDIEVIHTLYSDGTYDLEVETGDYLFDIYDVDDLDIWGNDDEEEEDDDRKDDNLGTVEEQIPDHNKGKLIFED